MTSTTYSPYFDQSCKPFNKAECTANKRLIDPCSCTKYYLCVNKDLVLQNCPQGTAYDHTSTSSICRKEEDIYLDGICAQNKPWVRCKTTDNVTDVDLVKLEARCTGSSPTPPNNESGDSSNTGAIIGGVLGGIILIAIVIVFYILYRRGYTPSVSIKKKSISKSPLHNQNSIINPQYFGQQNQHIITEEHYASIDDTARPCNYEHVNGVPRLPERPPSIPSSATNTNERKSSVASVQSYMEPSPTLKYGFHNRGFDLSSENGTLPSDAGERLYIEILPEEGTPSNGHIILHNNEEDPSPYDNSTGSV